MHAARGAVSEEVFAFVQIQRDEVARRIVLYRRHVVDVAHANTAAKAGRAGRRVDKRDASNLLRRKHRHSQHQQAHKRRKSEIFCYFSSTHEEQKC